MVVQLVVMSQKFWAGLNGLQVMGQTPANVSPVKPPTLDVAGKEEVPELVMVTRVVGTIVGSIVSNVGSGTTGSIVGTGITGITGSMVGSGSTGSIVGSGTTGSIVGSTITGTIVGSGMTGSRVRVTPTLRIGSSVRIGSKDVVRELLVREVDAVDSRVVLDWV